MLARIVSTLCVLSAVWLCLAGTREDLVIVCPDDYSPSPSEDCVPLHQLLSTLHLIHSNTTIQLLPAVFKLGPDLSISIANVSNITVGAAGPHRATISCTGSNSGFVFKNVSGLTVQNMNITNCASYTQYFNSSFKHSVAIFGSTNFTLTNVNVTASGVYAEEICGNLSISNVLFAEMVNSSGVGLYTLKNCSSFEVSVFISNSSFLNGYYNENVCAVDVDSYMSRCYLSDVVVKGNAFHYILLSFLSSTHTILERFRLEKNKFQGEMYTAAIEIEESTEVTITYSIFSSNEITIIMALDKIDKLLVNNTIFSNNMGSALRVWLISDFSVVQQSIFTNNSSTFVESIVSFHSEYIYTILLQDCTFSNNKGTSLALYTMKAKFAGTTLFTNNSAYNGAAMTLEDSYISILENSTLYFQKNVAQSFGGGIYVRRRSHACPSSCTLAHHRLVYFDSNVAPLAGNDIYGHLCKTTYSALGSPADYKMDVTSPPTRVCECSEQNIHTCVHPTKVISTVETYPGKQFNLSLLAVGQVLNFTLLSGAPSPVYAYILPQADLVTGSIPSGMLVQKSLRTCSNLTYSINSTRENEILVLSSGDASKKEIKRYWLSFPNEWSIDDAFDKTYKVPAYVKLHILPCPAGFNLSLDGGCVCSNALKSYDVECIIDTLMIHKNSPYFWLAINYFSGKVLAHRHCPFDYCSPDVLDFSLGDTDALCNYNRSGILCGACRSGYSLILGGTECRQCSNIYLLLLLPFVLAGILLVVFLSLTDMTVAAGTINGLLFYANIVTDNKATFFLPGVEDSFLSVFVQWLSLDLGIKSCFFDGLDAYTYTWLQLVFPVYVCLLAFAIIIASRYITWMNKLCGTNIVQVLATLFLLSYTKLQATIASGLSFTAVEVYDEEKLFVWLKDGNVSYLQGKHIALFLVSLLLLCVFSLYTLSIVLGPWLQRKTQYKVFCWVLKLKPLFDAYFGPLKNQYRYWTGLLLLSRTVLYLVSSVNVLGDDSANLLAIAILCLLLTWQSRCVYKHRVLSALDSFFLMNLCILSLVSLYNKLSSGGSQTVTIYVSNGSAFVVFCVTLLYHSFSRLKNVIQKKHNSLLKNEMSAVEDSDDRLLDLVDADRID